MRDFDDKRPSTSSQDNQGAAAGQGPGKRTLIEQLPVPSAPVQRKVDAAAPVMPGASRPTIHDLFGAVQRKASDGEPDTAAVQRRAHGQGGELSPGELQAVATEGVSGACQALPHLESIQWSFGPHDLSGVEAPRRWCDRHCRRIPRSRARSARSCRGSGPSKPGSRSSTRPTR